MKRAQFKIQQMIFVLIGVTLFIVIAGLFALSISLSGIRESAAQLDEENAMLLAIKIANSPEFSCGNSFGTRKLNCVDFDKVFALKDKKEYESYWGREITNIEIRKIFPAYEEDVLCEKNTYPDCNVIRIISNSVSGKTAQNSPFVSLCRKQSSGEETSNVCEIGIIMISSKGVNDNE